MKKHNENALDLGVSYPGQKKGEGKEENTHYFDIFKDPTFLRNVFI